MGEYQFEMLATVSDILTVDADSYEEALQLAQEDADAWYAVAPQGYSVSWDNVDLTLLSEPDDEEEE